jgi:hypothetical protein
MALRNLLGIGLGLKPVGLSATLICQTMGEAGVQVIHVGGHVA